MVKLLAPVEELWIDVDPDAVNDDPAEEDSFDFFDGELLT